MPQYTIRNIPQPTDRALRDFARRRGLSLNDATIVVLQRGLGVSGEDPEYNDLDELIGTWKEDQAFDQAIAEQDKIDPALWR